MAMEIIKNLTESEISQMDIYVKKRIPVFAIESTDIGKPGEKIIIHTLEGDEEIISCKDFIILIGPRKDVYPIPRELFESRYDVSDSPVSETAYETAIKFNWPVEKIKTCEIKKDIYIYAKQMNEEFSVFVKHIGAAIQGKKGDYMAVSKDDRENIYIIDNEIMSLTYERKENV